MVYRIIKDIDFKQIMESGQCFRFYETEKPDTYVVVAKGKAVVITDLKRDHFSISCTLKEYDDFWYGYLNGDGNYAKIKRLAETHGDQYVNDAMKYAHGIKILRQDLWETIVTFIITAIKKIPETKRIVESLSEAYGKPLLVYEGKTYYSFPTPQDIASASVDSLKESKAGFRCKFIHEIAEKVVNGQINLEEIEKMNYQDAYKYILENIKGCGPKVTNCICLYALHQLNAVPVDKWVKQIYDTRYDGKEPWWAKEEYAGIIQQYVFYYERHLNGAIEDSSNNA